MTFNIRFFIIHVCLHYETYNELICMTAGSTLARRRFRADENRNVERTLNKVNEMVGKETISFGLPHVYPCI